MSTRTPAAAGNTTTMAAGTMCRRRARISRRSSKPGRPAISARPARPGGQGAGAVVSTRAAVVAGAAPTRAAVAAGTGAVATAVADEAGAAAALGAGGEALAEPAAARPGGRPR